MSRWLCLDASSTLPSLVHLVVAGTEDTKNAAITSNNHTYLAFLIIVVCLFLLSHRDSSTRLPNLSQHLQPTPTRHTSSLHAITAIPTTHPAACADTPCGDHQ